MKSKLLIALLLILASSAVIAGKAEDQQIKSRQSAYGFAGWNLGKIKDQVVDHPDTYNKDQVIAAANAIAAVANSGLGALFGPGTDEGTGWAKTRLKPEFFQQPEEAKKLATDFNREANELAKVAAGGDAGAIKTQFAKLADTCKACHKSFKIKE